MEKTLATTIDKMTVSRNFSRRASSYDEAAVLQKEVGTRLLERLEFVGTVPQNILDLGSGTGFFSKKLQQQYPHATIIALDIAEGMLQFSKLENAHRKTAFEICGDAEQLPLASQTIDLIFSNCCLQWCPNLTALFQECCRVLKPGGIFLFSTFGPDTLKELRMSVQALDAEANHTHTFLDMHDLGDLLLHYFSNPVVDTEFFTLTYSSISELRKDLKFMGANYAANTEGKLKFFSRNINGKSLAEQYENFRNSEGNLPATFEVVYGYAIKTNVENLRSCNTQLSDSDLFDSDEIFRAKVRYPE